MAKTLINLSKQASGLTLNLGTEALGEASNLTLHVGTGTTESVVLDARGAVQIQGDLGIQGVLMNTSGITAGQALVYNGEKMLPTFVSQLLFEKKTAVHTPEAAWTKRYVLYMPADNTVITNGVYITNGGSGTAPNYISSADTTGVDLYNLSYNAAHVGKLVYVYIGNHTIVSSAKLGVPVYYEDLFEGRTSGLPNYANIEAAQRDRDAGWFFTVDEANSSDWGSAMTSGTWYFSAYDLMNYDIKFILMGRDYNPAFDGKTIYSLYGGDFWNTTHEVNGKSIHFTYEQLYDSNGVLNYSYYWPRLNQEGWWKLYHNTWDLAKMKDQPSLPSNHVYLPVENLTKLNFVKSIVLRSGVATPESNTLYAPNVDVLGITKVKNDTTLGGKLNISGDLVATKEDIGNIFISRFRGFETAVSTSVSTSIRTDVWSNTENIFINNHPVENNHLANKSYIDSMFSYVKNQVNKYKSKQSFKVVSTLAERNAIVAGERFENLHVAVQEGSTNAVVVSGVTHNLPRLFVLKPINETLVYIGNEATYSTWYDVTGTQFAITYNEVRTSWHPEYPNITSNGITRSQLLPVSATTVADSDFINEYGSGGFTEVVVFATKRYHLYFSDGVNYNYYPEIGQSVDIHRIINGIRRKIATRTTISIEETTQTYQDSGFYSVKYTNVAYGAGEPDVMGSGDQSNVWIETDYYDGTEYLSIAEADVLIDAISGSMATTQIITLSGAKDGLNKVYTYIEDVRNETLQLYLNGMLQSPLAGDDYTIDYGTKTITFEFSPETDDRIVAYGSYNV
jgi:hypothetical protein